MNKRRYKYLFLIIKYFWGSCIPHGLMNRRCISQSTNMPYIFGSSYHILSYTSEKLFHYASQNNLLHSASAIMQVETQVPMSNNICHFRSGRHRKCIYFLENAWGFQSESMIGRITINDLDFYVAGIIGSWSSSYPTTRTWIIATSMSVLNRKRNNKSRRV